MILMKYANDLDSKIMNWDMGDIDGLISQITQEELDYMTERLFSDEIEILPENYMTHDEYVHALLFHYVKQWLLEQINNVTYSGTRQLFEVYEILR